MWEKIQDPASQEQREGILYVISHRLKVREGWIVRTIVSQSRAGADVSQIFVSDPGHSWQLSA